MKNLFIIITCLSSCLISQEMKQIDISFEGEGRTYLIYKPINFIKSSPIDLFIGIHGYGGTASGFERETTGNFNKTADKYKFLTIYPQGKIFYEKKFLRKTFISSWNDLAGSKTITSVGETCAVDADIYPQYPNCKSGGRCSWTSCVNDLGFIKEIIDRTKNEFNIRNIYVAGMSNGGMMAQALACKYPELFSGVINVVGMQHQGLSCKPNSPVNFIIYGGAKDTTVPPVNIRAADGYFYEPMENTFDDWSKQFNCKSLVKSKKNQFDNINEILAFDCDKNVTVTSILNNDSGHLWPGVSGRVGYCRTPDQDKLNYDNCKEAKVNPWGNDYLISKILSSD